MTKKILRVPYDGIESIIRTNIRKSLIIKSVRFTSHGQQLIFLISEENFIWIIIPRENAQGVYFKCFLIKSYGDKGKKLWYS